ncbi:MAG: tyrosine-type recombinase/integrase [Legionellales bacterium]|nr:tyrosine-type recombinase/integrase [Legionellales bacterium]
MPLLRRNVVSTLEWNETLSALIDKAKKIALNLGSDLLFPNQSGKEYTSDGFRAVWRKIVSKGIDEKKIKERFRFHDIRRKTATDIERVAGRENARQLLGHSDQKTTGIYISGVQRVKPLN